MLSVFFHVRVQLVDYSHYKNSLQQLFQGHTLPLHGKVTINYFNLPFFKVIPLICASISNISHVFVLLFSIVLSHCLIELRLLELLAIFKLLNLPRNLSLYLIFFDMGKLPIFEFRWYCGAYVFEKLTCPNCIRVSTNFADHLLFGLARDLF